MNTWTDTEKERTELGTELAKTAVHFHADVKKPLVTVSIYEMTVNRSRADLSIKGILYDKPMEGTCSVEIIWHKEQCDRCNRISGSYYEGNIQVRAEGRIPSTFEIETAASVAQQVEDSLQAAANGSRSYPRLPPPGTASISSSGPSTSVCSSRRGSSMRSGDIIQRTRNS